MAYKEVSAEVFQQIVASHNPELKTDGVIVVNDSEYQEQYYYYEPESLSKTVMGYIDRTENDPRYFIAE